MLNGTIPDSIDNLVRLQNLNLRGNDITAVTPNISRCQMMTEFDISNNKLKEIRLIFHGWKDLQKLKMAGNKLIFLHENI